jgi:diaminohydroxyphosphoribosylaminopyrimidine deaminase/5-amino-6-(5-phosphoribosylamino)uracil reductase
MSTRADAFMRRALALARRGYGRTSPNPMVGAVLVRGRRVIGQGWHRRAGAPHAEIEALRDAERRGARVRGATLYVTLEPCSTQGRTPPCTEALLAAGIRQVVAGATDPNPRHAGRGFRLMRQAGVTVVTGVLEPECTRLNEAFNHWIVHRTPRVTVKAAMTLDGKIACRSGQSKWITGERARAYGMRLRAGHDAVLVGINTVLADDPSLTVRPFQSSANKLGAAASGSATQAADAVIRPLRRIVLDTRARTPLHARVVSDPYAHWTTVVVGRTAPRGRVAALTRRVQVITAPLRHGRIDVAWLLRRLGAEDVTSLLVEGGGEVQGAFLQAGLAQRIAFLYAPKILGSQDARPAVAGRRAGRWSDLLHLADVEWRALGPDLLVSARVLPRSTRKACP